LQDVGLHLDLVREIGILEMCRKVESRIALARENMQFAGCCVAGFDVVSVCVREREREKHRPVATERRVQTHSSPYKHGHFLQDEHTLFLADNPLQQFLGTWDTLD
jgi:hypothetical protein